MNLLLDLVAGVVGIASFVCWIIILIYAFKDAWYHFVLSLLCGLYLLFYALFEFEHENKWPIVILAFGGTTICAGILRMQH